MAIIKQHIKIQAVISIIVLRFVRIISDDRFIIIDRNGSRRTGNIGQAGNNNINIYLQSYDRFGLMFSLFFTRHSAERDAAKNHHVSV